MLTKLLPEEGIIMKGPASVHESEHSAGGMLYLTPRRLIFESHRPDGRDQCTEIALSDIATVTAAWSKLFNLIPIAPNVMSITTARGDTYHMILFGRRQWIASIQHAMSRQP